MSAFEPITEPFATTGQRLAERGWLPDPLIRLGIRRALHTRLTDEYGSGPEEWHGTQTDFRRAMSRGPIALSTQRANQQHYEVPPEFFERVLGPRLKYSCGYWEPGVTALAESEEAMLRLTCQRAGLEDGMSVLELGCGWGSLSLWIAEHYPRTQILAVSNSAPQRAFIEGRARAHPNLAVETADMNEFRPSRRFDRVLSVEMFEHMRNWRELLRRIATWMEPDGRAFLHHFCHRELAYPYEAVSDDDWMARFFFTDGLMPSASVFDWFDEDLSVEEQWSVEGTHYGDTCRAWLDNLDRQSEEMRSIFERCYGPGLGSLWLGRWRIFFLACEELFRFRAGREWFVLHTRLRLT